MHRLRLDLYASQDEASTCDDVQPGVSGSTDLADVAGDAVMCPQQAYAAGVQLLEMEVADA